MPLIFSCKFYSSLGLIRRAIRVPEDGRIWQYVSSKLEFTERVQEIFCLFRENIEDMDIVVCIVEFSVVSYLSCLSVFLRG